MQLPAGTVPMVMEPAAGKTSVLRVTERAPWCSGLLAALICVLTAILALVALVFGVVGLRMPSRLRVTG
ncbi:hypothetical protein ABZ738_32345 [Micromonospora sp. NPDC047793]|uniref:hypothetical protein n=1 Tax=Micromonospora sp. NPDC047793 TaxID=3154342 RepID=UPI0034056873